MDNKKTIHENIKSDNPKASARAKAKARAKARARRRGIIAIVCCAVVLIAAGILISVFSGRNKDNTELKDESSDVLNVSADSIPEEQGSSVSGENTDAQDLGQVIDYDKINLTGTEVFAENILIEKTNVSGLTYEEAQALIKEVLDNRTSNEAIIKISKDEYRYTLSELGVIFEEQELKDILKEAIVYGNHGSLLTEYKEKATLNAQGKDFELSFTVDENKINQTVTELSDSYTEQLPQDAEIHRVNGAFIITEEVFGVGVDIQKTVDAVIEKLNGWEDGSIEISADVVETYPKVTADKLRGIKDLLGSCKTKFTDGLSSGRGANLKVGTAKIDDRVLMPGETLSVHDCLAPFTIANGYYTATAYANGGYVDSIGGGICQIATTLYDACLEAEIEIVKRSNHSMVVGYVDRAFDATVNDSGSKDLIIKNNYDTPIYIEAYLYNMNVCINIYGAETRDPNRVVEYYSVVLEEAEPSEEQYVYTIVTPGHPQYSETNGKLEDELVGPDEILQIQGNYPMCKAKLYKKVTVNGKVVEDTCLHTDKYRSSPAKFLVGANYPYPGKVVETTEAATENPAGSIEAPSTAPNGNGETQAPTQTQPPQSQPASDGHPGNEPSGE